MARGQVRSLISELQLCTYFQSMSNSKVNTFFLQNLIEQLDKNYFRLGIFLRALVC